MPLDERKIKEIEHSDRRRSIVTAFEYRTDASPDRLVDAYVEGKGDFERHFSNMKYYSVTQASCSHRDTVLFDGIKGAVALDYCCGNGEAAVEMAARGAARVVGIDISTVAVENARNLAKRAGMDTICEFVVMDAEHTEFPDRTFDVIHEYGALHHLELTPAYQELARILKPEGKVVCTEALRHNPLIHWYRKRTPQLRTCWEVDHILGVSDLNRAKQYFGDVSARFFHLAVLAAVPFRKTSFFKPLCRILNGIDAVILRNQGIGKYGWITVFSMRRPGRKFGPAG